MNEPYMGERTPDNQPDKPLSTADMAAAAETKNPAPPNEAARKDADTMTSQRPADMPNSDGPATPGTTTMVKNVEGKPAALLSANEGENFRTRWTDIQAGFVDEPRKAVEQADALVAEVMKHLAETFAEERTKLEGQWGRGDQVSTEDLRVALQRYRSFFDRLLAV